MRRSCLLLALILALVACDAAAGRALHSGIAGRVVAGPTCPVETFPPQPGCEPQPLVATLRIRHVGSDSAVFVRSRPNGRFRVRLSPATYIVRALPIRRSPLPSPPAPRRVEVHTGHFTYITVSYDTGIR